MSHKLQIRALIGLVVVITIVVGVLVWPAPREARADIIRSWYLVDNVNQEPVLGASVQFSQETAAENEWTEWVDAVEVPDGSYKHQFATLNYRWRVRVLLPWHGDWPNGDTQTFYPPDPASFNWVVWSEE